MRHLMMWASELLRRMTSDGAGVERARPGQESEFLHRSSIIRDMTRYNMVTHPDESYYAGQYSGWIVEELTNRYPERQAKIIDLGCGQGRLSVPLAEWCSSAGGTVTGVDITPAAVEYARRYAARRGLGNVTFQQGDVLEFARSLTDISADAILLVEVTFILRNCAEMLRETARVLRPGGVLFVAFRSQYYNLLQSVRACMWDAADAALDQREGHLFDGPVWFTWQTPEDIQRLLSECGLRTLSLRGIGVFSGVKGDPLADIAKPSRLSERHRERLMKLERAAAEQYAGCGRYILATAERST